jgi:hypothetical protein
MGRTLVVYHNPSRRDTFGVRMIQPKRIVLSYAGAKKVQELSSGVIPSPFSEDVRAGKVERIDIDWE